MFLNFSTRVRRKGNSFSKFVCTILGPKGNQIWNFFFSLGEKKSKAKVKEQKRKETNFLPEENIRNRGHVRYYTHERNNDKVFVIRREKETDFNGGDSESTWFEDETDATCRDSFSESTHYSTWNHHILHLLLCCFFLNHLALRQKE